MEPSRESKWFFSPQEVLSGYKQKKMAVFKWADFFLDGLQVLQSCWMFSYSVSYYGIALKGPLVH